MAALDRTRSRSSPVRRRDRRGVHRAVPARGRARSSASTSPSRRATSTCPAGAGGASFASLDVRDEDAVAAVVDAVVVADYGRLDVVVTAAGVAGGGPAHLVERDEWQRVLDVNLTGTFLVCKHAIARMLEQEPIDGETRARSSRSRASKASKVRRAAARTTRRRARS